MPSPEFRLRVVARPEHIDELAHVSNVVYVQWLTDVALAHSSSVGWTAGAYLASQGVFVARRHEIDYLSSAVAGDEIELITWVESFTAVTSRRLTRMVRVSDGKALASASTVWAYVSTQTGRPQRIPAEIAAAFGLAAGSRPD